VHTHETHSLITSIVERPDLDTFDMYRSASWRKNQRRTRESRLLCESRSNRC